MSERRQQAKHSAAEAMHMGRGPGGHGRMMQGATVKAKDSKGTMKRLFNDLRVQKKQLLIVLIVVLVGQVIMQLSTVFYGQAVKETQRAMNDMVMPIQLMQYVIFTLISYVLSGFMQWLQQFLIVGISQSVVFDFRSNLFSKLQKLSLRFFDSHDKGDLMSRLTNDVENINNTLSNSLTTFIASIASIGFTVIMMLIFSWKLTLGTLVMVPCILFFLKQFSKLTRKFYREQQKNLGIINGQIEEVVTGHREVKIFCSEEREEKAFHQKNQAFKRAAIKAQMIGGMMGPTMNLFNNINFLIVSIIGAFLAINGHIEIWLISQFFIYVRMFGRPLAGLGQFMPQIQSALAGVERIYEIMDEHEEIIDSSNSKNVNGFRGEVTFKNVSFSYDGKKQILKNINLNIKSGEQVAFVGPTGAGKTTIINLLTRFYDVNEGEICIDGVNIKEYKKRELRKQLGIVLQDVFLFAGTVKENILYGRNEATDEEVKQAAQKANAHQFIHRLPNGYETDLSEAGSNLSQGQRQLLSISRAMLANPSILILDEATSSVDTRTEKQIQKAMTELMKNRTSFVIAHRLSTIRDADKIVFINDGAIAEEGTHEELIKKQGYYYELYKSQFKPA